MALKKFKKNFYIKQKEIKSCRGQLVLVMSAVLLCVFVLGTQVSAGVITRNVSNVAAEFENRTKCLDGNGFFVHNPNRRIVVEEVDKHGKSVVKELELPDYEESEEEQQEKRKVRLQEKNGKREDLYGCNSPNESRRKKCLQRQKKFIKGRYKNWKALFRKIIKDLDGQIKTIGQDNRKV